MVFLLIIDYQWHSIRVNEREWERARERESKREERALFTPLSGDRWRCEGTYLGEEADDIFQSYIEYKVGLATFLAFPEYQMGSRWIILNYGHSYIIVQARQTQDILKL